MEILVGNPEIAVEVSIPSDAKKIGVLVSGGADSAILLYMLAVESKNNNVTIETFTVPRRDGAINYSPKIVEEVSKLSSVHITLPISVGEPSKHHHSKQTRSGHIEILNTRPDIDYIFYGSQSIASELSKLNNVEYPARPSSKYAPGKTVCPFFNLTKEHTIDLYYKLGVEDLLKYSHSCTAYTVGRCNNCFNCIERAWAFTKINKVDPGTM